MNNHLQPAIPRSPSIPANTPAAIKPLKPVARIWAQYNNAIRVATSEPLCQLQNGSVDFRTDLFGYRIWTTYKSLRDRTISRSVLDIHDYRTTLSYRRLLPLSVYLKRSDTLPVLRNSVPVPCMQTPLPKSPSMRSCKCQV
jgi:hypothetical protein